MLLVCLVIGAAKTFEVLQPRTINAVELCGCARRRQLNLPSQRRPIRGGTGDLERNWRRCLHRVAERGKAHPCSASRRRPSVIQLRHGALRSGG